MRIQVFLSHNGVCSRREAMDYVKEGRVSLNGTVVLEPSTPIDPHKDQIKVDGRLIEKKSFQYVLLNKPAGFVTTKEDAHAQRTVMDLLPQDLQHVVPVGRLDKDTEGLLLLTNDGDLTFRLTHPQFDVDKTYLVHIGGKLLLEKKYRLETGVVIEGKMTKPAQIRNIHSSGGQTEFLMVIQEGRKRQIRLMLKAVGCAVSYLKRMAQGPLQLGELPLGKWRALTAVEVQQLKSLSSKKEAGPADAQQKSAPVRKAFTRGPQNNSSIRRSNNSRNLKRTNTRRTNNDYSQ
ncbi:MAG: rRNA pseudouridine synthase [Candidatus Omnitrophica bacterium]|nr:rRNA pseudouridine synthase [Candidatus Omnitrophota bacterium]